MDSRERVSTTLAHRTPDRPPVFMTLTPQVAERMADAVGLPREPPLDSLLSTVQMPGGTPVATTAIGKAGARNAALLAAAILALSDDNIKATLEHYREMLRDQVDRDDKEIN